MTHEPQGLGLDPHGEVFVQESRVLRALRPDSAQFYMDLAKAPFIERLIADGLLIPTCVSDEKIDGFAGVLEHPKLSPLSFPFEWPPSMLKAAALALLQLNIRLMEHGYCTIDGHPWNILFDGTHPRFSDFTSIMRLPSHGRWEEVNEFAGTFFSALRLMEKGYPTPARMMLREMRRGPDPALANSVPVNTKRYESRPTGLRELGKAMEFAGHMTGKLIRRRRYGDKWNRQGATREGLIHFDSEIRALDVRPGQEMWSDYYRGHSEVGHYDGSRRSLEALPGSSQKHRVIRELLERLKPASVLDVACNRGPCAQMAALKGARAVGIDIDEAAIDAMYLDSVALGTGVVPLFCDVVTPAEPVTMADRAFPPAYDRLRADCVLCLALVHHLVFRRTRLRFEHIARILAALSNRHLVVEFIPHGDRALGEFLDGRDDEFRRRFDWYTIDNFRKALSAHFPTIEVFDSRPAPRQLLLCTR